MKPNVMLTVASLLSVVLLSLHISEDIVLGFSGGGLTNLIGIAILVVYLCGALLLGDRRSGLIILLIGSILAAGMPIIHMTGAGRRRQTVRRSLLLCMDPVRARRDRDVWRHPRGADPGNGG